MAPTIPNPLSLGAKVAETGKVISKWWFDKLMDLFEPTIIKFIRKEVVKVIPNPDEFSSPEMKEAITTFKTEMSGSPVSAGEVARVMLETVKGNSAELQLEKITNITIGDDMPTTSKLVAQMAMVTDVSALSSLVGIMGQFIPTTQLGQIGAELRSYMDYSGVSQVTGTGYGMILQSAIGDLVAQEIRAKQKATIVDPGTLRLLHIRNTLSDTSYTKLMNKWGYGDEQIILHSQAGEFYPQGQDFVRFAVREVFDEKVVAANKYDEAFPTDILPHAAKAGMKKEQLKWYWRAHWELPSPRMGYEMLHRKIIDEDRLKGLLKTADYAPGWIQEMIDISYSPLTRVDARRMFETNVITEPQYISSLEDIGYSPENAALLVEWAKERLITPEKDLSKAQILDGYELGILTKSRAAEFIGTLGYDAFETDLILALEDAKQEQKDIRDELEVLRYELSQGALTEAEFKTKVEAMNIPPAKIAREVTRALKQQRSLITLPAKADVLKWDKENMITTEEAQGMLSNLGYQQKHIKLYLEIAE